MVFKRVAGEQSAGATRVEHMPQLAKHQGQKGEGLRFCAAHALTGSPDEGDIHEPTRLGMISYAVFCLKKKITRSKHIADSWLSQCWDVQPL
ncbi:hypothetical protein AMBR_LLDLPDMO_03372 [Lactiplantibacillus plantarum]|nr:hypothetical protein AMBR_LLDLPDMO_03372 [Lactiplantibacillus plantarum]